MSSQKPPIPDPLYLALSRKLVLLLLLMVATAMGLVALLVKSRLSNPILAYLLTDCILGLVAGFSVRWILPRKAPLLRICSVLVFVICGLALLGWFTGWSFGINSLRAGRNRVNGWEIGQILLATGFALLALYSRLHLARIGPALRHKKAALKVPHPQRKPKKRLAIGTKTKPASPSSSQVLQPASQPITIKTGKSKRKRSGRSKPKLLLSGQEQHRCPYCLELIDKDDRRGVVECEICHTLHHADCWAITGTCQVPHYTAG
jgi:hypothetical protein